MIDKSEMTSRCFRKLSAKGEKKLPLHDTLYPSLSFPSDSHLISFSNLRWIHSYVVSFWSRVSRQNIEVLRAHV